MGERTDNNENLSKKYKQPKNVEQYGIEVIPDELRTVKWWDISAMVLNFVVNPGTIVISGSVIAAGLSFSQSVLAGFFSILMGFSIYLVAATVGVDYGIPGIVSMRSVFGIRGSWITSALRTISSVYWFAFQTVSGSLGLIAVLKVLFDKEISFVTVCLMFAFLQVLVALFGYNTLRILSRFAFVLKIVFALVIVYVLMNYPVEAFHPSAVFSFATGDGVKWALIGIWSTSMAAAWFSNFTDAADFCRYSKTRVDMWIGTIVAAAIGQLICSFVGGYAVAASGGQANNAFDVIVQASDGAIWFLALLVVFIILDNWCINVQNLYTGGLALTSIFEPIGRFWGTIIVSAFGVGLSVIPNLVEGYIGYMGILGDLFAPMGGIFVAHYVLFARGTIDIPALFGDGNRYWFWKGVNMVAVAWIPIGFMINQAVPTQYLNILVTAIVTGAGYAITVKILRRVLPSLDYAAKKVEFPESESWSESS